jgi:outer membrane biosynthesis protein TonB
MNLLTACCLSLLITSDMAIAAGLPSGQPKADTSADSIVQTQLTRKERLAFDQYHRRVRDKIEACANRGILQEEEIDAQGTVFVSYAISSLGEVENVGIRTTSGKPELDEVILRIMNGCGPVDKFPNTLVPKVDRMIMTSGMAFTSQPQRARLRWVNKAP